jgi:hypothetical protein
MRIYSSLLEAAREIKRDIYSGQEVAGTRVQQKRGHFSFRERLGYDYAISGRDAAWPMTAPELVKLGQSLNFKAMIEHGDEYTAWLIDEVPSRTGNPFPVGHARRMTEKVHPALASSIEGNWPAYTYTERLSGAIPALADALSAAPDTRRAYWPIFQPIDALRASAPTRVPCSLGYQAIIRPTDLGPQLYLVYLQRSADFDQFWLTDIWLARQFQTALYYEIVENRGLAYEGQAISLGPVIHQLISFHSFEVSGTEVY